MSINEFKCEICGNKINKISKVRDMLPFGNVDKSMDCKNCGSKYKPCGILYFFAFWTDSILFVLPFVLLFPFAIDISILDNNSSLLYFLYMLLGFVVATFINIFTRLFIKFKLDDKEKQC